MSKAPLVIYISFNLLTVSCDGEREYMLGILKHADSLNVNYLSMEDDTLLHKAVAWFDRWGTSNDRVRAHYLLGCYYRDLGSAPEALEEYYTAVSYADTSVYDCDYHQLSRIHGQMAELYLKEYLPQEMLKESSRCQNYSLLDGDSLMWITSFGRQSLAYYLLGNTAMAAYLLEKEYDLFCKAGDTVNAANSVEALPLYLMEKGKVNEASYFIHLFEEYSEYYDKINDIALHDDYYYIKGLYFHKTNNTDSAIIFFRKLLSTENTRFREMACNGLYQVFIETNQHDSALKYADLSYQESYMDFRERSTDELRRLSAIYDYSRHQKIAHQKELEAAYSLHILWMTLFVGFSVISFLIILYVHQLWSKRKQIESLTREYSYHIQQILQSEENLKTESLVETKRLAAEQLNESYRQLMQMLKIADNNSTDFVSLRESVEYKVLSHAAESDFKVTKENWKDIYTLFDEKLPMFKMKLTHGRFMDDRDLQMCMLIRMEFKVSIICKILGLSTQYVSTRRRRLLKKLFKIDGKPEDFDNIVLLIN